MLNASAFAEKRKRWIECLEADDPSSVFSQIHRLVWNAVSFRTVLEARRLAEPAPEGGVQLGGLLHGLLDECFFDAQAAIRRLTDRHPLYGVKGVNSLAALLEDIVQSQDLFTRQNMLQAEGLNLELERLGREIEQYRQEQVKSGKRAFFLPDNGYHRTLARHEQIDWLTGVDEGSRSESDRVNPQVLIKLRSKLLTECGGVHSYVDTYVAHNASAESRAAKSGTDIELTLGQLWRAHRFLCVAGNFVSIYLLGGATHGVLAHSVFDQFEYLDRPLIRNSQISQLQETWDKYERETEKWTGEEVQSLALELGLPKTH